MPEDFYTTEIPETMGRWRVEVSPAIEKEEDVFLHLIQVSNKKDQEMCSSKILEEEDKLIVSFSGIDGINYEVIFNKTKEIGGHIKIVKGGKILWDKPLIKEVMPQSRLAIQNYR